MDERVSVEKMLFNNRGHLLPFAGGWNLTVNPHSDDIFYLMGLRFECSFVKRPGREKYSNLAVVSF